MTNTVTIFGDYHPPREQDEFLTLTISSSLLSLQNRWFNNSLTSVFLADYWYTYFNSKTIPGCYAPESLKEIITYIVNELLDNAVKYGNVAQCGHLAPKSTPQMVILICFTSEYLRFYVTNHSEPENWDAFQEYINILLTEDAELLYFRQMEQNAVSSEHSVSRLGLLSIIHDYHGQVAWKFELSHEEHKPSTVTTMVQLPIKHQTY
jgi:hypothetical protein